MAAAEQDGPNYNIVPAENETPITEIAIPKYEAICLGIGRANSNEIRQIDLSTAWQSCKIAEEIFSILHHCPLCATVRTHDSGRIKGLYLVA